ncbi:hypothetical protein Tco_0521897 [Tanacetum coccineum]
MDHHEGRKMEEFVEDTMGDPRRIMEQWKPQRIDELPDAFCGDRRLATATHDAVMEPKLLDVTIKYGDKIHAITASGGVSVSGCKGQCVMSMCRRAGPEFSDALGMETIPPILQDIIVYLQLVAHQRSAKSVIGLLLVAAASYCIWLERNNRTFKNTRRSPKEIRDIIVVIVRLKLLTCRFKNTAKVNELLARWKMPKNFRSYGIS